MDMREEMRRWVSIVMQEASDQEVNSIKEDIDFLLGASAGLIAVLSSRCESTRKKSRRTRPKAPKKAPTKTHRGPNAPKIELDSAKPQKSSQGRPQEVSRIQQGILQASKSQQRALRHEIYGPQNREVALIRAARELAG